MVRHAIRVAALVAGTDLVVRVAGIERGYWISLTVLVVLRPDFGATLQRAVMRIVGTIVGLLVATELLHWVPGGAWWQIGLIAAFSFGMRLAGPANVGLSAVALSGLVVVLLEINGVPARETVVSRAVATLIGGALAVLATLVLPGWERSYVRVRVAALLAAYHGYVLVVADPSADPAALQGARSASRLARTNAQASIDRARAEPVHSSAEIEVGNTVLAHSHRFIHAMLALDAVRVPVRSAGGLTELRPFLDAAAQWLAAIGQAVRDGRAADGAPARASAAAAGSRSGPGPRSGPGRGSGERGDRRRRDRPHREQPGHPFRRAAPDRQPGQRADRVTQLVGTRSRSGRITNVTINNVAARNPVATQNDVSAAETNTRRAASAALKPDGRSAAADVLALPNTVTNTASPSAPPTCCMTLTRPDAAPASRGSTPSSAAVVSGTNASPFPAPNTTRGPTSEAYPACSSSWVSHSMPRVDSTIPVIITGRAPSRSTSHRADSCDDANTATVIGRNANPVSRSLYPSTPRRNWVRKKNIPNIPATSSSRADVRTAAVAIGEQPQWRDRGFGSQLDDDERSEQPDARGKGAERLRCRPPVAGRVHEPVHERSHPERRRESAGEVEGATGAIGAAPGGQRHCPDSEDGQADRDVDEQHPTPRRPLGEHAARDQADRAAADGDGGVQADRTGALPGFGEHGHQQRERGGRGECRPDALGGARREQLARIGGEARLPTTPG